MNWKYIAGSSAKGNFGLQVRVLDVWRQGCYSTIGMGRRPYFKGMSDRLPN